MPATNKSTKKSAHKSAEKAPVAAVPAAESSSKPSKSLKRKKEVEHAESKPEETEPVTVFKKVKKDDVREKKPSTAPQTSEDQEMIVDLVAEKPAKEKADKKKKYTAKEVGKHVAASDAEEKTAEIAKKPKGGKAVAPAPPSSDPPAAQKIKGTKKSKSSEPISTSISRPRKPEASKPKSKTSKVAVPEPESDEEEEPEEAELEESNNESDLHGFSTDDDDSSDEEDAMDDEPSAFDVAKLPTVAKDDASVKRKLEKAKKQPIEDTGVLFLGRLPHGFYEDQLKAYFSQFGNVTRLRISRNKKTGKSKHYGFIEFDSLAVAKIVAETMDNYLLMGHILRCKLIPKGEVHPELWVGANRKWRVVPKEQVARAEHNKPRTQSEQAKASKRLLKRQEERKQKLAKANINYNFDAVSYKKPTEIKV
ncbi:putative RNA-binding protein [Psilocybe cubensis]|uniref:RRM domain-containing protein n=2 Tax=Psilocybe cubensis TaxID=181762 RepID=A0A8H7Y0G1_PSICU|nr:putative RNA-binding protein [Psilocybe cubensis]KAH9481564.1 putative RNA-binding protein [Psilocybe cubensis]